MNFKLFDSILCIYSIFSNILIKSLWNFYYEKLLIYKVLLFIFFSKTIVLKLEFGYKLNLLKYFKLSNIV